MADTDENKQREDLENQVWSAISAFEQIVEMMPDDRVSLDALSHAYEQAGDLSRAREYLGRLVNVVITEKDRSAAGMLLERVVQFAASDPIAREIQLKLDAFLAGGAGGKQFDLAPDLHSWALKADDPEQHSNHVAAELAFAWTLFQAGELSQEEYAVVAQDLGALSGKAGLETVSLLHVLQGRKSRALDRILAFAARDSAMPVIPLALFEVQDSAFQLIPHDVMVRFGMIPFEVMGQDLLVALLNPYNRTLKEKIEQFTGRRCHYFMTPPADFDATLDRHAGRETAKVSAAAVTR
jgi:hypothetical protein